MSSKSAAHPESHGHTLFSRKFILIAAIAIVAIFFLTVTYYPLIFSSETHNKATVEVTK